MLRFETWKIALVAIISLLGVVYALPNLLDRITAESLPDWLPHDQISLGLDLQGGSHLLLEVDIDAVFAEQLETMVDEVRVALRGERIGYTGLGRSSEGVTLTIRDAAEIEVAGGLLGDVDPGAEVAIDGAGNATITLTEQARTERQRAVVSQSIEIVRRRIDETGTREPTIQRQGEDRILLQLPGVDDPERIKRLLGKTAKMNFRMVDEATPIEDAIRGRVPPGSEVLYEQNPRYNEGEPVPVVIRKRVSVSGDNLVDAQPTFQDNQPVVSLRFDAAGGRKFGALTKDNVGKRFAIVLDGEVISAPVIREPIPGGTGIISGSFTVQSAQDLALLLRAGALPAPLTILEERTVGPSLGADSIAAGKVASVVGMLLVVGYMIMSYGLFGIAAVVALVGNMALIVALLSVLGATLTLPGIAGIVLTIGMAVDANVLIFERIREEVRNGRSPFSAVDIGFQKALTTIVDANITTLIAAVLLYQFGSGPVRGFAVTLAIGIGTSMFTAIMVTRLLVVLWLQRVRPKSLPV
ncbi:MAG: protein translocase subunit SecD [Alphaproteobacteria bacterium]|jgi:preprotein translocase subunit SecD|nr:protein translocase subunit SecD [Alphaproteobacteria bacterium]MDP6517991.1 protein translocase subunit SecD [Alphaproteobacteria bacterium]